MVYIYSIDENVDKHDLNWRGSFIGRHFFPRGMLASVIYGYFRNVWFLVRRFEFSFIIHPHYCALQFLRNFVLKKAADVDDF